jgi:hypothetical protein
MLHRVAAAAILSCLLGGCTDADWNRSLSYVGLDEGQSQTVSAKPVSTEAQSATNDTATAPAKQTDPWCDSAGQSAAREARESGFDEATQRRQAELARNQCLHH